MRCYLTWGPGAGSPRCDGASGGDTRPPGHPRPPASTTLSQGLRGISSTACISSRKGVRSQKVLLTHLWGCVFGQKVRGEVAWGPLRLLQPEDGTNQDEQEGHLHEYQEHVVGPAGGQSGRNPELTRSAKPLTPSPGAHSQDSRVGSGLPGSVLLSGSTTKTPRSHLSSSDLLCAGPHPPFSFHLWNSPLPKGHQPRRGPCGSPIRLFARLCFRCSDNASSGLLSHLPALWHLMPCMEEMCVLSPLDSH